jgi:hypothetical protein
MFNVTTTIGDYDKETNSVTVSFTYNNLTHTRNVVVALDTSGNYDAAATSTRVAAISTAVAMKIDSGVISLGNGAVAASE